MKEVAIILCSTSVILMIAGALVFRYFNWLCDAIDTVVGWIIQIGITASDIIHRTTKTVRR